jgi:hypothetical protein
VIIPDDWLEFRRPSDRECIGWLRPAGDDWIPVDLLGRDASDRPLDLDAAESALDGLGLGFLAERWELEHDTGRVDAVRIVEASPDRIVVALDDYGSASAVIPGREPVRWTLPWPAPAGLRLRP